MEIIELAIMSGLVKRGHRVHALVSGWNDGDFPARLDAAGIPYTVAFTGKITARKPAWMFDTLRHLPGARRNARRLVRALHPDVVIACNRDALVLLTGVFRGVPVLYHVHEALTPAWVTVLSRIAERFVTVSRSTAERLLVAGVGQDRVTVAPNGVARLGSAHPRTERYPPVVGICGQVGPWKGHDDLFDALSLVASRGISFDVRVFGRGDDDYIASLNERAESGGLAGRIQWMGFEVDTDRMYAGLDLLAVPSRSDDPFPTTVLEAGVRGLPVIGTLKGGIPEMIDDGETGFLVPPQDPAALADALSLILVDDVRRLAMGDAARARIEAGFLSRHMVDRFEAVLEQTRLA